jgi:hypothetical protein
MALRRIVLSVAASLAAATAFIPVGASASTPTSDVRLTNDHTPGTAADGYVSDYTMVTGQPYTDPALTECSRSRGRQNEPSSVIDPRDQRVIVGSSNDYCAVYDDGSDANGAPIPSGPIWLGYYRSEDGGHSFQSSLVPGYPGDTSPYAARAHIRVASAGDPVWAWDSHGRLFGGSEASGDPAGTAKTFGDEFVATYENPAGSGGATIDDGKEFIRSVTVAKGSSAPNLLGKFNDKTAIEADRTGVCDSGDGGYVYFAWSRFTGIGNASNIYFSRSTDHGATWSSPLLLTKSVNNVQVPEITVTGNGHVYVSWVATLGNKKTETDAVQYARSTSCGSTFAPTRTLQTFEGYAFQDALVSGGGARDCGDFQDACASGYTFFRADTTPRATTDQNDRSTENVYFVWEQAVDGGMSTGTTYGVTGPGESGRAKVFYTVLDGATGTHGPVVPLTGPTKGHQLFPDIAVSRGVAHVIWWDTRNDPSCATTVDCAKRPIGNYADQHLAATPLQTFATAFPTASGPSGDGVAVSDVGTNPNYEQFDGRSVPFAGDYLWIDTQGSTTFGTWTDWRDTVPGTDARESASGGAEPGEGADVKQCRTVLADGSVTGDTCPRDGGLDQNIYGDLLP